MCCTCEPTRLPSVLLLLRTTSYCCVAAFGDVHLPLTSSAATLKTALYNTMTFLHRCGC